jgi:DNA repair photolyase
MNAGLDFETRILVKTKAPALFREFLCKKSWRCEQIVFSGVTDCYQPAERKFRLTRGCLEVASEANQPIGIITKNALVARDVDLLASLAERNLVHVNVSVTTLDPALASSMEPRTSVPAAKLRAIKTLSDAGVPVRVMVAPVVPGLTDMEIPKILEAVSEAGAKCAAYVLLRLPLTAEPVFREWLRRERPLEAEKVENNLLSARDGRLYRSDWGQRMVGVGPVADRIRQVFDLFKHKHGLHGLPPLDTTKFRPPRSASGQGTLF